MNASGGPPREFPVALADPDPNWRRAFENEATRIRRALRHRALTIDHVGSTSVPGLLAKPIIDIVMSVQDSRDEDVYLPALASIGYTLRLREPDWHEHRLLNDERGAVNLHVFTSGDAEIERMVAFRDRLRADPSARNRYAEEKRKLAAQPWRSVQDYADAKSPIITEILTR